MSKIIAERMAARMEGEFVVFLIGMRVNKFWKLSQWLPLSKGMRNMLKELQDNPASGFLGAEKGWGRTVIMVQYWESFEKLEAYANNRDNQHYPASAAFNKRLKNTDGVGIWHEAYKIRSQCYESIYYNMPAFGLGKVGQLVSATGQYQSAKERMNMR